MESVKYSKGSRATKSSLKDIDKANEGLTKSKKNLSSAISIMNSANKIQSIGEVSSKLKLINKSRDIKIGDILRKGNQLKKTYENKYKNAVNKENKIKEEALKNGGR